MRLSRSLAIAVLFLAAPLHALIGTTPTIRAMAVVPTGNPSIEAVALLGTTPTGAHQLILRTVNRSNGYIEQDNVISFDDSVDVVDVIAGPGTLSALCDNELVLQYGIAYDAFGFPKLMGDLPTILGPFGNPAIDGSATVMAEAPGGIMAIGTESGRLNIISPRDPGVITLDLGPGPITGLGTVAQVGAFAFVAAHNGHVVGVNVNSGATMFDLADPRPDPLIELSAGAVFEPNDEPLTNPIPVPIVTANGTKEVTTLWIPANPTVGGVLGNGLVVIAIRPIVEVDLGSLFLMEEEGAVLYQPHGGVTFTVAGAVADLKPDTLNLASKGRFVTAMAECQNNLAGRINTKSLALRFGSLGVPASLAVIGDSDGDGQVDLTARFDRGEVATMLHGAPAGSVTLRLTWTYDDGSAGSAAADLRVLH